MRVPEVHLPAGGARSQQALLRTPPPESTQYSRDPRFTYWPSWVFRPSASTISRKCSRATCSLAASSNAFCADFTAASRSASSTDTAPVRGTPGVLLFRQVRHHRLADRVTRTRDEPMQLLCTLRLTAHLDVLVKQAGAFSLSHEEAAAELRHPRVHHRNCEAKAAFSGRNRESCTPSRESDPDFALCSPGRAATVVHGCDKFLWRFRKSLNIF